jgi:hypothetical protein
MHDSARLSMCSRQNIQVDQGRKRIIKVMDSLKLPIRDATDSTSLLSQMLLACMWRGFVGPERGSWEGEVGGLGWGNSYKFWIDIQLRTVPLMS